MDQSNFGDLTQFPITLLRQIDLFLTNDSIFLHKIKGFQDICISWSKKKLFFPGLVIYFAGSGSDICEYFNVDKNEEDFFYMIDNLKRKKDDRYEFIRKSLLNFQKEYISLLLFEYNTVCLRYLLWNTYLNFSPTLNSLSDSINGNKIHFYYDSGYNIQPEIEKVLDSNQSVKIYFDSISSFKDIRYYIMLRDSIKPLFTRKYFSSGKMPNTDINIFDVEFFQNNLSITIFDAKSHKFIYNKILYGTLPEIPETTYNSQIFGEYPKAGDVISWIKSILKI